MTREELIEVMARAILRDYEDGADMSRHPVPERAATRHALAALAALEAAGLRLVPIEGWQPIETAPKDVLIDIWIKNSDDSGVRWTSCYYDQICDQWRTAPGGHLMWVSAKAVTHWRPMPAPPVRAALKETTDV